MFIKRSRCPAPCQAGVWRSRSEAPPAPTAASPLPPVGSCVDLTTRARGVKPRPRAQLSFSASHGQAEKRQDGSRDVHPLVTGVKLRPDGGQLPLPGAARSHVETLRRAGGGGQVERIVPAAPPPPLGRQTAPASSLGKRGWTSRNQGFPLSD